MITPLKSGGRQKVNFMIDEDVLAKIKTWVVPGERSDFVNTVLQEALRDLARKRASAMMDEFRSKTKIKMTDEQIRKAINYGRE